MSLMTFIFSHRLYVVHELAARCASAIRMKKLLARMRAGGSQGRLRHSVRCRTASGVRKNLFWLFAKEIRSPSQDHVAGVC